MHLPSQYCIELQFHCLEKSAVLHLFTSPYIHFLLYPAFGTHRNPTTSIIMRTVPAWTKVAPGMTSPATKLRIGFVSGSVPVEPQSWGWVEVHLYPMPLGSWRWEPPALLELTWTVGTGSTQGGTCSPDVASSLGCKSDHFWGEDLGLVQLHGVLVCSGCCYQILYPGWLMHNRHFFSSKFWKLTSPGSGLREIQCLVMTCFLVHGCHLLTVSSHSGRNENSLGSIFIF